jgi:GTPase
VVLTKIDAVGDPEQLEAICQMFRKSQPYPVFTISAVSRKGLEPLLHAMFEKLDSLPVHEEIIDVVPDTKAFVNDDSAYEISHAGKTIIVTGGKLDRLVRVTDFRNPSATRRMLNIFKAMGVFTALKKAQARPGQTVIVGGYEFTYQPED